MFPMVANSNCYFFFFYVGFWSSLCHWSVKFILYLMVPFIVAVNYLLNKNVASVNLPAHSPRNCQRWKRVWGRYLKNPAALKQMTQARFLWSSSTLEQITLITPIVILIDLPYFKSRSCKIKIYILHWMEVFST